MERESEFVRKSIVVITGIVMLAVVLMTGNMDAYSTVVNDCEDSTQWMQISASLSNSTNRMQGLHSINCTISSANGGMRYNFPLPVNWSSYNYFIFWINQSVSTSPPYEYLILHIYSDSSHRSSYSLYPVQPGWQKMVADLKNPSGMINGGADFSQIRWIEFQLGDDFINSPVFFDYMYVAETTKMVHNLNSDMYYDSIQQAIDNASDGDTIFVYNGTYYENVIVDRRINLTGENKETTIIDGGEDRDVIEITGDEVNISGFFIVNSGAKEIDSGIKILFSKNCTINDNIISNNTRGITIYSIPLWKTSSILGSGAHYTALHACDMDGDGIDELLAGNRTTNRVEIWSFNASSGAMEVVDTTSQFPYSIHGITAGDYDENGDMDIVTAIRYYGTYITYNLGSGWSTPSRLQFTYGNAVSSCDFNNDNHLDILAQQDGKTYVIYGNGSGEFTVDQLPSATPHSWSSFSIADLDGDGDMDLVGRWSEGTSWFNRNHFLRGFLNNGTDQSGKVRWGVNANEVLGFYTGHSDGGITGYILDTPYRYGAGDVNSDGYVDIIAWNQTGSTLEMYIGYKSGDKLNWSKMTVDSLIGVNAWTPPRLADLNGDENLDIIFGGDSQFNGLRIYYGDGRGNFVLDNHSLSYGVNTDGRSCAVGDFNGDGLEDIAFPRYASGNDGFEVWLQNYTSSDNSIYHNNFINNIQQAFTTCNDYWDNEYPCGGNYWDDFDSSAEGAHDNNSDGIIDSPYSILGGDSQDRYPLIHPYGSVVNLNTCKIYLTIQAAVDDASEGDIIKIYPGVYNENIIINKPLKLIGDPIIDAHKGIGIRVEANDTLIENMTIYNFSMGIYVHNDSFIIENITINGCTIYNFSNMGYGIYFENASYSLINNTIINDTFYGIYLEGSPVYIFNNTINHTKLYENNYGIYQLRGRYTIMNNTKVYDNNGYGIYLQHSYYNKINVSSYGMSDKGLILLSSDYNIIMGAFYSNVDGIVLSRFSDFNNISVHVHNNSGNGIYIGDACDYNIINNSIVCDNGANGIYIELDSGPTGPDNNVISNIALCRNGCDLKFISPNGKNNTFSNITVSSYPTTFDINFYDGSFIIDGVVTPPSMPDGFANISKFLNITGEGWLNLTIYYDDDDVTIENESTILIWKYNDSWHKEGFYSWKCIDSVNNKILVNITSFSIFAPLQDITPPITTIQIGSPNYGQYVTIGTPIWLNATDNENGTGVNATYYRIWENGIWHPVNSTDYYDGNINIWNNGTGLWYIYRRYNNTVHFPIYLHEKCSHYIIFYSIDFAGNEESVQNQTVYVDDSPPYSDVNDIIPYCQHVNETNELTITATAHDEPECGVGITNITLYYRFARYNHSFSPWIEFGIDSEAPWQWQFNASNGSGYYQFYTVAYDFFGHSEAMPDENSLPEAILSVTYNHSFKLYQGWNMICLPVKSSIQNADDLGNYINSFSSGTCTVVTKWDASEQQYISRVVGVAGQNFEIEAGYGYFIFIEHDVELYIEGCLIEYDEINITLYMGYNLIGWANIENVTAQKLGENITGCWKISKWNASLGWLPECIIPWKVNNFDIRIGDAIFIYRNTGGVIKWNGGRDML